MQCGICGSENVEVTYNGYIRNGKVGTLTEKEVEMFRCRDCGTIWHEDLKEDYASYYQSEDYRKDLEGTSDIADFYRMHDAESMDKFLYTGTEVFRDKTVADIGCGGGAFLDYVSNVAKTIIAIEPSKTYRKEMQKRNYCVFPYATDALKEYRSGIDVIVSFDVIEHVQNPETFIGEAYELLSSGGVAYIGTPTDAPVMRELLGRQYESFLFSTQHPWVLGKGSFEVIAANLGIKEYKCKFYQRYGLGNCFFWLLNKCPGRHKKYDFITKGMDALWKAELEKQELADYVMFEFKK